MISQFRVLDRAERLRRADLDAKSAKTARSAMQGFEMSRSGLLVVWSCLVLLCDIWACLASFGLSLTESH